jgi:hypothetical protein
MKACRSCHLRGYSRELCYLHIHRCHGRPETSDAPPSLGLAGRVAMGVAVGVFGALTVSVAASFFSGLDVFRSLLPVLVVAGSIPGAVYGFVQDYQETHALTRSSRRGSTRIRSLSRARPAASRARPNFIFVGQSARGNPSAGSASNCP